MKLPMILPHALPNEMLESSLLIENTSGLLQMVVFFIFNLGVTLLLYFLPLDQISHHASKICLWIFTPISENQNDLIILC